MKQKIYMKNFSLTSANMDYLRITSIKKPIAQQNAANGLLSFPRDITEVGKRNF